VAAEQLCEALEGRTLACAGNGWLAALREQVRSNEAEVEQLMRLDSTPINPYRLAREIRDVLPRNATICDDGEVIMGVSRSVLPSYGARLRLNAGPTACIGTGVPYAIGAALAYTGRTVVAVLGDYAFGGPAIDIETAARVGAKVVFVVANNAGIAGHLLQDWMFPPGSPPIARLLPADYEKMSEMVGGHAERVERPAEIRPALERALAAPGPALVNVFVDPNALRPRGMIFLE
jgi:thiamine pyrophosphate-dependent acetolactate synthase large subunit-like protein